ncbi:MAG TPA: hypothetical protein ENJ95_15535 [Bacteroidetes bacterium]|nr:hypothetical protein [Bacteroidota bacterium]
MMKNYMLSLSLDELLAFNKEQFEFLEKALKSSDVSEDVKNKIFNSLGEMEFLMKAKVAA